MTNQRILSTLSGASLLVLCVTGSAAYAQDPSPETGAVTSEEIIVTARRKDESAQDVPLVVNAVTSEDIGKLNIRRFEDVAALVPGLTLSSNQNGIGTNAAIRGVNYDVAASGNNGTIEFYLNDAPVSSNALFQSLFDVGQIEVLRGPQGTLRGRASPSGSITVITRKPDLQEYGGYANVTANDIGGINVNGAVNIPIVKDIFGVRIGGVFDDSEDNRVRSVNSQVDPSSRTRGVRVAALLRPTDNLSFETTYLRLTSRQVTFDQRESVNAINPGAAASPVAINARDRLSVTDFPNRIRKFFEVYNWQGEWRFAGQKLNYVGSYGEQDLTLRPTSDPGDFFGPTFPAALQNFGQSTHSQQKQESHELRLSSDERALGLFDYVVGAFVNRTESPSDLVVQTPILFGLPSPTVGLFLNQSQVARRSRSIERSLFGNVTLHLGDSTEVSGGLRYINYKARASLAVGGVINPVANENTNFNTVIYSGSLKHRFNDNLMAYASVGSSWRPGISAVGDFNTTRTALEQSFIVLPPEKSRSYEIGVKTSWLDDRLKINLSAFHQDFTNYPYRVSGRGVFFVNSARGAPFVDVFNFVSAVPVKVHGLEFDASYQASRQWNLSASASYARGKIQNGLVPCNDANVDGIPDASPVVPTLSAANRLPNGDVVAGCRVNYRASFAPLLTATLQSEYTVPLNSNIDGYIRGLLTFAGDSQNDPSNAVDNVKAYALLNLYAGVRDPDGKWEITLFGKNITNTFRVLSRTSGALTTGYNIGASGFTGVSSYREITSTAPREFGINLRYAFGSR